MRAESNAAVGRRFRTFTEPAAVALCLGALLWPALPAMAGEKFEITGSTNKVELPAPDPETLLPSSEFMRSKISPGESSQGPAVPPPGQAILIPTPKLEELVDRKKNWMFDSPNRLDRDRALEETFGIRKYDFTGSEKKPKGAVERYFQSGRANERRPQSANGRDPMNGRDESDRELGSSRLDRPGGTQDSGIIEELNPAYLFDWETRPNALTGFGRGLPGSSAFGPLVGTAPFSRGLPGDVKSNNNPATQNATTERSWDFRRSGVTGIADPINDPIDPTRAVINPISARKPGMSASEPTQSSTPGAYSIGRTLPISARPGFLESTSSESVPARLNSRPPAAGPAGAPTQRPKPMILEIPRPMF